MNKYKVTVIGMGYIGLPTSLALAYGGVDVLGYDLDSKKINTLQSGKTTFKEKGLDELFAGALQNGVKFTSVLNDIANRDVFIISVPTPYDRDDKKIDPSYVVSAFNSVYSVCKEKAIIIIESTISPGTIDRFVRPLVKEKAIHLVHCPERIIPGNMIYELKHNSRTIGCDNEEIGEIVKSIYQSFCDGNIVITSIKVAEMTKVVENTFRDINIAFANELVKICEKAGIDVYEVIRISNMHPRVNILQPGPGVGGHCISVDPWFLVGDYPEEAKLVKQARLINDSMPSYVLKRVKEIANKLGIKEERIGIYGLTYKENVDDVRESPSLQMIEYLESMNKKPFVSYDPWVETAIVPNQTLSFDDFLNKVDLIIVMQNHSHIINAKEKISGKVIFDTKHCLEGLDKLYRY
ncbi:MAG: nucleotide sugar dehydrogenase [Bacilli bacterium]|nr:nucleotide sugar dehydrogenase [Bacilli bacterium]